MSKNLIYADHAATTQLCDAAWAAMTPFLREEFGNPSSLHSRAKTPREAVSAARATIAACIGAEPGEIVFTSGGTEWDNWVIKGSDGNLMVSTYEHHAILNAAANEASAGRSVAYVKPKMGGYVVKDKITAAWHEGIKLVSIMAANNEIGTRNILKDLADHVHGKGALFHTDAVQAVGHIPIDVREMGVDFLSASAHKFNGPKGIGFLYIRKGQKLRSLLDGGQQENGFRAGTENVAAIVGMATALKNNCTRMDEISAHLEELTLHLRMGIERFYDNPVFLGAGIGSQLPGFTSVSFPGHPAEGLMHMLDLKGIAVSTGAACDSRNTRVSHVLKAINATNDIAHSTIRITLGAENTIAEVNTIVSTLKQLLRGLGTITR